MHKLLIADDDRIISEGIITNIDWASNGIEIVGCAHDGQECLEMIMTCLPEVILSDIKMPFLDGLALAESVQKLYPQIKVVLLTAYNDFHYMQRALELKITKYVMKYENDQEILNAVLKAFDEYDKQKFDDEIVAKSKVFLKNKFLVNLITHTPSKSDQMIEESEKYGIHFSGTGFCVGVLNLDDFHEKEREYNPWKIEIALGNVKTCWDNIVTEEHVNAYSFISHLKLIVLFHFPSCKTAESNLLAHEMPDIVETLCEKTGLHATLCIGNCYNGIPQIGKSYQEALQIMEIRSFLLKDYSKNGHVIFSNTVKNISTSHQEILQKIRSYIDDNYYKADLSLNSISDYVHISCAYISTLFKKYCGVNITEYITDIRMRKAAELLVTTNLKTYEITDKVGYANSHYFSILFKKYTNCSPTQYRQNHINSI